MNVVITAIVAVAIIELLLGHVMGPAPYLGIALWALTLVRASAIQRYNAMSLSKSAGLLICCSVAILLIVFFVQDSSLIKPIKSGAIGIYIAVSTTLVLSMSKSALKI